MTTWTEIVSSSLTWEQAHATLDKAVEGLPKELRGKRPPNFVHSVWELVEHIRLTQKDLLDFMADPSYHEPKWPDGYWPPAEQVPTDAQWTKALEGIRADAQALAKFTVDNVAKLTEKIPRGTGQTYLRTVLVAVDHTSYHVGQIVAVRRLLGAWTAS